MAATEETSSLASGKEADVEVRVHWSDDEYVAFTLEEAQQIPAFGNMFENATDLANAVAEHESDAKGKEPDESKKVVLEVPLPIASRGAEKLLTAVRALARVKIGLKKSVEPDAEEAKTILFRPSREDPDAPFEPNPVRKEKRYEDVHDDVRDAFSMLTEGEHPTLSMDEFLSFVVLLNYLDAEDFLEVSRLQFQHLLEFKNRDEMIEMFRVPKSECFQGEGLGVVKKRNNWLIALDRYDQEKDELRTAFPLVD